MNLLRELANDFCEGPKDSVTDTKNMGYVQLESVKNRYGRLIKQKAAF